MEKSLNSLKNIYLIRHGLAQHNVNYLLFGKEAYIGEENIDTQLVPEGIKQAKKLGETWKNINDIDFVLVSPLTRTLQTAQHIFKDVKVPIVACEELKEFSQGIQTCNKRIEKSKLKENFPFVDFSLIRTEKDEMWNPERFETEKELSERVDIVRNFIKTLRVENVAIISHSTFIMKYYYQKISQKHDDELKHCLPYRLRE